MTKPKVGFLSSHNYFDRRAWSGLLYSMYYSLQKVGIDLEPLGLPRHPSPFLDIRIRLGKLSGMWSPPSGASMTNAEFTALACAQIKQRKCDCVFAPIESRLLANLDTPVPIVYLTDLTFQQFRQTYKTEITELEVRSRARDEALAIQKSRRLVVPTQWAADSAVQDYGVDQERIDIIPFGANIENPPPREQAAKKCFLPPTCRLLFVGKDWERKGGSIAVQTLQSLQKMGVNAELTIVGSTPPNEMLDEGITVHSYINKNTTSGRRLINELYSSATFFIFPSRAEAFGVVICEANAYGLPVIAAAAGGIPSFVREGVNGFTLPLSAGGKEFAAVIAATLQSPERYAKLVRDSRLEYENKLNWNSWAQSISRSFLKAVEEI